MSGLPHKSVPISGADGEGGQVGRGGGEGEAEDEGRETKRGALFGAISLLFNEA